MHIPVYAYWNHDFTDCRKMLVNITDKWYVYPQNHTSLYTLAFINTFNILNYRRNDMADYEESYKNYLAWLTPRELLQEFKIMRFPWRYRERKWIKEEIERRCVY